MGIWQGRERVGEAEWGHRRKKGEDKETVGTQQISREEEMIR